MVRVLVTITRLKVPNLKGQNARKLDVKFISIFCTLNVFSVVASNKIYNFKKKEKERRNKRKSKPYIQKIPFILGN